MTILSVVFPILGLTSEIQWGFWAHQRINRLAVFMLPPEMQVFFKKQIDYLTENAVNPDKRRYAVVGEAPRHYIDAEAYGDSALYQLPLHWNEAVKRYVEDTSRLHAGISLGPFSNIKHTDRGFSPKKCSVVFCV
ncbi:MAG: hypothetical protein R2822_23520 [Spirosomataceae bacterium]